MEIKRFLTLIRNDQLPVARKLKAFTLVEMLIVLLTVTLLISMMAEFCRLLLQENHTMASGENKRNDMVALYVAMQTDISYADTILITSAGITFPGRDTVRYLIGTGNSIRIGTGGSDTLSVVVSGISFTSSCLQLNIHTQEAGYEKDNSQKLIFHMPPYKP